MSLGSFLHRHPRVRLTALLSADQLPKYEQMVTEHDKAREQERERSKK